MAGGMEEVTVLLQRATRGDAKASAELLPLVYEELRRLARARMNNEREGLTLQPTALVHEAYIRLVCGAGGSKDDEVAWDNRGHFFGAAARAMRRILIERARHQSRVKHGGGRDRVDLTESLAHDTMEIEPPGEQLEALDAALHKLEAIDARKAEVVMLRHFAGLKLEEIAAALGVSLATVKNDWSFAKAWLHREIETAAAGGGVDGAGGGGGRA